MPPREPQEAEELRFFGKTQCQTIVDTSNDAVFHAVAFRHRAGDEQFGKLGRPGADRQLRTEGTRLHDEQIDGDLFTGGVVIELTPPFPPAKAATKAAVLAVNELLRQREYATGGHREQ